SLREVLPPFRLQPLRLAALILEPHSWPLDDLAYLGDCDSGNFFRNPLRRREEQFVVVPAVESVVEGRVVSDRHLCPENYRAHFALLADVGEIRGEAIADVDHGGSLITKLLTDPYSGFRREIVRNRLGSHFLPGI